MSGHGGGEEKSLKLLIGEIGLVVAGLWIIWFFSGGPERAAKQGDLPFTTQQTPIDGGRIYDANGNSSQR